MNKTRHICVSYVESIDDSSSRVRWDQTHTVVEYLSLCGVWTDAAKFAWQWEEEDIVDPTCEECILLRFAAKADESRSEVCNGSDDATYQPSTEQGSQSRTGGLE